MAPSTTNNNNKEDDNLSNPAFFGSQSQKLSALLDTVVRESATATNPDAPIDFLQLTDILSSLLEEAQMYSVMSGDELQQRRQTDVRGFMGRIETVEEVIADWDGRSAPATAATNGRGDGVGGMKSRKRARTVTHGDYDTRANRRRLESETEQALNMAPTFDGPYSEMIPLNDYVERDHAAWWTEPYYD